MSSVLILATLLTGTKAQETTQVTTGDITTTVNVVYNGLTQALATVQKLDELEDALAEYYRTQLSIIEAVSTWFTATYGAYAVESGGTGGNSGNCEASCYITKLSTYTSCYTDSLSQLATDPLASCSCLQPLMDCILPNIQCIADQNPGVDTTTLETAYGALCNTCSLSCDFTATSSKAAVLQADDGTVAVTMTVPSGTTGVSNAEVTTAASSLGTAAQASSVESAFGYQATSASVAVTAVDPDTISAAAGLAASVLLPAALLALVASYMS